MQAKIPTSSVSMQRLMTEKVIDEVLKILMKKQLMRTMKTKVKMVNGINMTKMEITSAKKGKMVTCRFIRTRVMTTPESLI